MVTTDSDTVAAQARGVGGAVTFMERTSESYTGALIDVVDAYPARSPSSRRRIPFVLVG